ncbi:hypothetical protein [Roseibacillus ishigakijimensis]|nr:hypothetical protein [Roseibacillus ishigakijimensis]
MFDLFEFYIPYFNYLSPLVYLFLNGLGFYGGWLLKGRTRSPGPLFVLWGSIFNSLLLLLLPTYSLLNDRLTQGVIIGPNFETLFWLVLDFGQILSTAALLFGLVLIAQDFRAHLEESEREKSLSERE